MKRSTPLLLIMLAAVLCACRSTPAATPTRIPPTNTLKPTPIPPTSTLPPTPPPPTPSASPSPNATLIPTSAFTPTPFSPFDAVTNEVNANLRSGPGYLFPILGVLDPSTRVSVLGKAPGGEWFRVRTANRTEGWIFGFLLFANVDLQQAPVVQPQNVQLIEGRVLDGTGVPIRGVGFTLMQGNGVTVLTNTAATDSNGEFYSFLPGDSFGTWTVSFSAIGCDSNAWADATCTNYANGYQGVVNPESVNVTLPSAGVLDFTWS